MQNDWEWEGFVPDRRDGIFALVIFIVGFLFARWVLFYWQGWGVTVFTVIYCGSVMLYFHKKGLCMARVGWFWLGAVISPPKLLPDYNGLEPWRNIVLFCGAVQVVGAAGLPTLGKRATGCA